MNEFLQKSTQSESQFQLEMARCRREIAGIEALLLAGHPDIDGLTVALSDWSAELWLIEQERDYQ
jgi:hypothetical protein